ncbi:hypothetical protein WICPIJ_003074 [Wickerhamomyces pijperi]|uniref:tRNA (adenine(58)-N(1))-methyltransferase catalytic subunit TRM61 n=1 Tax=Wickerhamomyces pijperi TaxID=599730 RepID=A0A9P8Q7S1_WICPI|nr:hypothetical protein WICPIJ_003074 [Wickerhamomyces pijperi]
MLKQQLRQAHFKAGDHALLRPITNPSRIWLTKPLTPAEKVNVDRGAIPHSCIIGLKPRSLIKSKTQSYIVTKPTTEEYITLGKRAAQPIYHHDANAIVNLADIHATYPEIQLDPHTNTYKAQDGFKPKQYLEAGTGHASLSLSIAQRIHAANSFLKPFGIRGSVLHSIDNNPAHSKRGSTNLKEFRNGVYQDDVSFHVADDLSSWFQSKECHNWKSLSQTEEEFLDGIFLDMPAIQDQLQTLTPHLKHDSPLVTFVPSVTQIIDILRTIQDLQLPLIHIGTYQLGSGTNGGGLNEWDVKFTRVRKTGEQGVVCRPKVGVRVVGGGFVAVFRKLGQGMVMDIDGSETTA